MNEMKAAGYMLKGIISEFPPRPDNLPEPDEMEDWLQWSKMFEAMEAGS